MKFSRILAAAAIALSGVFAAYGAEEDEEIGCAAKYHTYYRGYVFGTDGSTNATVNIVSSQRAKNGVASLSATFKYDTSRKRTISLTGIVHLPDTVELADFAGNVMATATATTKAIVGTVGGEDFVATVAGMDVEDFALDPFDAVVGAWTFALTPAEIEAEADAELLCGYVAVSIYVKKKGKTTVVCMMPNGNKLSKTVKLAAYGEGTRLDFSAKKNMTKGVEMFSFSLVFDATGKVRVLDSEPVWKCTSPKNPFSVKLSLADEIGRPAVSSKEAKKRAVEIDDENMIGARISSATAKTGIVKGAFVLPVVNARGRTVKKRGTIWGVDVNGVIYGSAYIKKLVSAYATAAARAE